MAVEENVVPSPVCWVIYSPGNSLSPEHWVARQFVLGQIPTPEVEFVTYSSLDDARANVPEGLVRIERDVDDDPHAHESWM